jgi:hypothetical protein
MVKTPASPRKETPKLPTATGGGMSLSKIGSTFRGAEALWARSSSATFADVGLRLGASASEAR